MRNDYDEDEELHEGNFEVVQDTPVNTEEEVIPPIPSEDQIHAYVHHHRVKLVKHLTAKNQMPASPQEQVVLLAALKDMDGSANARKRLAVDAANGDITAGATAVIAKLLTTMGNNAKGSEPPPIVPGRAAPKLGSDVPAPVLLDGETATTLPQQSYATFMSTHTPDPDASPNSGS